MNIKFVRIKQRKFEKPLREKRKLIKQVFTKSHKILDCRQNVIYSNRSWCDLENMEHQDKVSSQSLKVIQSYYNTLWTFRCPHLEFFNPPPSTFIIFSEMFIFLTWHISYLSLYKLLWRSPINWRRYLLNADKYSKVKFKYQHFGSAFYLSR